MIWVGSTSVLFTAYAPAGIDVDAVRDHLRGIQKNVSTVSPNAETALLDVVCAR